MQWGLLVKNRTPRGWSTPAVPFPAVCAMARCPGVGGAVSLLPRVQQGQTQQSCCPSHFHSWSTQTDWNLK